MCTTNKYFSDTVSQNLTGELNVWAVLAPNTNYFWEVTDQHNNRYFLPFTTDSDGLGTIDASLLPDGFFNAYNGGFTINVKLDPADCDYVPMSFVQKYETICIKVVNSNVPKIFIGCPIDIALPERFTSEKFTFIGEDEQTQFPLESYPNYEAIKNKLTGAKQLLVFNEAGILSPGLGANEYQFDSETGIITFGQTVAEQKLVVVYFK